MIASRFETELPPNLRERYLNSSPASPQARPQPHFNRLWYLVGALAAVAVYQNLHHTETAASSPPAPVATPSPVIEAPRATPVEPVVPRAVLVRLPRPDEWKIGQTRIAQMPYGLEVLATLKAKLSATSQLPRSGNYLGDTYQVGQHYWVWVTQPGAGAPSWIDP